MRLRKTLGAKAVPWQKFHHHSRTSSKNKTISVQRIYKSYVVRLFFCYLCSYDKALLRLQAQILPDSQSILHTKADTGDCNPTAKAHNDWLTAGFDQLYNIGV